MENGDDTPVHTDFSAKQRGSSQRKLLEGDFLIPNSGEFRVVLLENAVVWHRTKPSSDKAVQGKAASPQGQRQAFGEARRVSVADIYAVEGLEEAAVKGSLLGPATRLHRLAIHTVRKAADRWIPVQLVMSHADVSVCQQWVEAIRSLLNADSERPKNLLAFINPIGGHRKALKTWAAVKPVFGRAGVAVREVVTQRQNHAFDSVYGATDGEISAVDGILVVGGDGLFNEVLNGLAKRRHHAPPCIHPSRISTARLSLSASSSSRASSSSSPAAATSSSSVTPFPAKSLPPLPSSRSNSHSHSHTPSPFRLLARPLRLSFSSSSSAHNSPSPASEAPQDAHHAPLRTALESAQPAAESAQPAVGPAQPAAESAHAVAESAQPASTSAHPAAESAPSTVVAGGAEGNNQQNSGSSSGRRVKRALWEGPNEEEGKEDIREPHEKTPNNTPGCSLNAGLHLPNRLRIGIIPAGSTDCIIMSVTGSRDPTTAALHVVLGHRMPLDVARITTWRGGEGGDGGERPNEVECTLGDSPAGREEEGAAARVSSEAAGGRQNGSGAREAKEEDDERADGAERTGEEGVEVRYAASFFGYGFYGDVIRRSEALRWMGPARYDYAGLMTYLHHRSYDADVSFFDVPPAAVQAAGATAAVGAAAAAAAAAQAAASAAAATAEGSAAEGAASPLEALSHEAFPLEASPLEASPLEASPLEASPLQPVGVLERSATEQLPVRRALGEDSEDHDEEEGGADRGGCGEEGEQDGCEGKEEEGMSLGAVREWNGGLRRRTFSSPMLVKSGTTSSRRSIGSSRRSSFPDVCTSGCAVCASSTCLAHLARSSHNLSALDTSAAEPTPASAPRHQSGAATSAAPGTENQQELQGKGEVETSVETARESERNERSNVESEGMGAASPLNSKPCWRTVRGKFHSVGAAVMSCRNDKAPDGVAAQAHLADGNLHLILIRKCSRPEYLHQLIRLARKGADPFAFDFVETYKTPAFTFTSHGKQSTWNVDGELVVASQLAAQVFRGLVDLFASGPEF